MKFSPKCRTKKLGMNDTHHFGKLLLISNWEGTNIRPQIRPRKIPALKTRNSKMGTLANSEDSDEMMHNAAFHRFLNF